jgi:uncharacterized protein (DUF2147 family)
MKHRLWLELGLALLMSAGLCAPATAQDAVSGAWRSADGSELVIAACPAGFCGTLTKPSVSREDIAKHGSEQAAMESFIDERNPDEALRSRPLIGLEILRVSATANPWFFEGQVYNPTDGKTYSGAITVTGADTMVLKGCAVFVFCREEQWTRVVP